MNERSDIARQVEQLLEPRLQTMGYELVACDWRVVHGRQTLQLFIDRDGGIRLEDCVSVSRSVGDLLDVEDLIEVAYHLEVSSPGLDRPLRKAADFERFRGREVRIRTFEPIEGRRNYRGRIAGVGDGLVTVEVDGRPHVVPLAAMDRANLVAAAGGDEGGAPGHKKRTKRAKKKRKS